MKKELLSSEIHSTVARLLELARDLSHNDISSNCLYILTEIENSEENTNECQKKRKKINDKKTPKSLAAILTDLDVLFPKLFDVNLYIYKAKKDSTIIEIQNYPRTALDIDYQKITANQEPLLQCKVSVPPYATDSGEKFDINWELGTLRHKWKLFWWKRNIKKYLDYLNQK